VPRAEQAAGDASKDGGDIGGAEAAGELGEAWAVGALLKRVGELSAVIDQFADDAEDAADGGGHGRGGPRWIGVHGWGGGLVGRHERQ
jgi:hypothetical protein